MSMRVRGPCSPSLAAASALAAFAFALAIMLAAGGGREGVHAAGLDLRERASEREGGEKILAYSKLYR